MTTKLPREQRAKPRGGRPAKGLRKWDIVLVTNPQSLWAGRVGQITSYSRAVEGAVWVDLIAAPGFKLTVPQQFLPSELLPSIGAGKCDGCGEQRIELFTVDAAPIAGAAICTACAMKGVEHGRD